MWEAAYGGEGMFSSSYYFNIAIGFVLGLCK